MARGGGRGAARRDRRNVLAAFDGGGIPLPAEDGRMGRCAAARLWECCGRRGAGAQRRRERGSRARRPRGHESDSGASEHGAGEADPGGRLPDSACARCVCQHSAQWVRDRLR